MRGRIGGEREVMPLGGIAQLVEHDTRLHARGPRAGIELYNAIEILRTVDHDRDVAALAGETSAAAAREDRNVVLPADGDCLHDVFDVSRDHDPNGYLPIVRTVRRV